MSDDVLPVRIRQVSHDVLGSVAGQVMRVMRPDRYLIRRIATILIVWLLTAVAFCAFTNERETTMVQAIVTMLLVMWNAIVDAVKSLVIAQSKTMLYRFAGQVMRVM
jgi:hypothetical protein